MSHQAGLPLVEGDFTLDEVLAWEPMVDALAAQEPIWEPGTKHGYHMRTFGWLVGELIRRVDGGTIVGTFWRDEIADAARPRLLDRPARGDRAARRAPRAARSTISARC